MTLNKREQKIAWVVGGLLGLYAVYAFVLTPFYLEPLRTVDKEIAAARVRQQQEKELLDNRAKVRGQWDKLAQSGLEADSTTAQTFIRSAIDRMLGSYRVNLISSKFDPPLANTRSDFSEMAYGLTVSCTSSTLASVVYTMETAGLPIRVDNVTIQSMRPGEDNLNAEIKLVVLLYSPRPASIRIAGTRPGTGGGVTGRGGVTGATRPAAAAVVAAPEPADEVPSKEVEDLAAKLRARRAAEEAGMGGGAGAAPATPAGATPTATPTPTTAAPGINTTTPTTTQPAGGVR